MNIPDDLKKEFTQLFEDPNIAGILITNREAEIIAHSYKVKHPEISVLTAASAASVSLSKISFSQFAKDDTRYIIDYTESFIYVTIVDNELIMNVMLNRSGVEARLEEQLSSLQQFLVKIKPKLPHPTESQPNLIEKVRSIIPEAQVIAIVSHDGLPISVESKFDSALLSGLISAFFTSGTGLADDISASIIIGKDENSLILYALDNVRILAILIPKGIAAIKYLQKIRESL